MLTVNNFLPTLDAGRLQYERRRGEFVTLTRRGTMKQWRTQPGRFIVPVMIGEIEYGSITELCFWSDGRMRSCFREKPNGN